MSENFQNSSTLGSANTWQVFVPVISNAASLAGSTCNASALSSAWLLPSAPGTLYQPLMGAAYPYQQINTGMLSGVSGQNQTFTSAASYPTIIQWDTTGSAQKKPSSNPGGFIMTVTDQNTAFSSMSVAAQYANIPHTTSTVPLYTIPTFSGSHVKRTPPQCPQHSQSLMLPYQEGSQVHYYNQDSLRSLLSQQLVSFLQSYDPMSYTGVRGSALQNYNSTPEMPMGLKEVQLTNTLPLASTAGFYNSASVQPTTESRFQVMNSLSTQASLRLQPESQTYCQIQNPEFLKSSRNEKELHESNPLPEIQDSSMIHPVQSSLAPSLAPDQDPSENKNLDEINKEYTDSLDSCPNPIENKDPCLCPVESPDLHQFLTCFDPLDQDKQVASQNKGLGKSKMSYEDDVALESDTDSSSSLADVTIFEDINCPTLLKNLHDLDQNNSHQEIDTKGKENITSEMQKMSSAMRNPCDPPRKNKHKACKPIEGEPQNKIQRKTEDHLLGEEVKVSTSMPVARARSLAKSKRNSKQQIVTSSSRKSGRQEQPKPRRAVESKKRKVDETRLTGTKGEAEGKTTTIAQKKRKRNPPEVRQDPVKKPRSSLGLHMLETVQVLHALGKRRDLTPGQSSSRFLGNSNKTKGFQPSSVLNARPRTTQEVKGVEKQSTKTSSNPGENNSSPIYELPPPGKVKLIPLPFFPEEKPPRVPRRPRKRNLSAPVPAESQPTWPGSSSATQTTAGKSSQPIPSPVAVSERPVQSFLENAPQATLKKPTSPPIATPETSNPSPVQATFSSLLRDPRLQRVNKGQSPRKSHNPFLLKDFSAQPIPWREPNEPEPVISTPMTNEQRPEREAMKKKAQWERYNASKYTSLGKVQFFPQRERDINISLYYGYVGVA